jgi:hypothetical protein
MLHFLRIIKYKNEQILIWLVKVPYVFISSAVFLQDFTE